MPTVRWRYDLICIGHNQNNSYNNLHRQGNTNVFHDMQVQGFQSNQPWHGGNGQHSSHRNQGYNHDTKWNQRFNRDDRNLNFGHNQSQVMGQARPGHSHQLNSQDARYVDVNSMDPMGNSDPILQNTLAILHEHKPIVSSTLMRLEKEMIDAAVITRAQQLVNPPTKHMAEPSTLWNGSPNFVQLNKVINSTMQDALNEPPLDKPSIEVVPLVESDENEDDDNLYRFVDTLKNRSHGALKPKPPDYMQISCYELWALNWQISFQHVTSVDVWAINMW